MDLEAIFERLLTPDTELIKEAQGKLLRVFDSPTTYNELLFIMANNKNVGIRQYAALLLRKRLSTEEHYKLVPLNTQICLKDTLLDTIHKEQEGIVRTTLSHLLAYVLLFENCQHRIWVDETIQTILQKCCGDKEQEVEMGVFLLTKIADVAPEIFIERFSAVKDVFEVALRAAESNIDVIPSNVMNHLLTAMASLAATMEGSQEAEKFYEAAIPYLVNLLTKIATKSSLEINFYTALDILYNLTELTPYVINSHINLLVNFTLSIGAVPAYDDETRIECLTYLSTVLRMRNIEVVYSGQVPLIIDTIFNILSTEPESNDAEEFFTEAETDTVLAVANQVMDALAKHISTSSFFQPCLNLIEAGLSDSGNYLRRRGAFIALGTIAEGCRNTISEKYLTLMLNVLKQGLNDAELSVRSAALFAVGQFSEQLQPEIAEYADDILPALLSYAQNILQAHPNIEGINMKNTERTFYAVEAFCSTMDNALQPYMEQLLCLVFTVTTAYPRRLQRWAIDFIQPLAGAYTGSLVPYCELLLQKLYPILMEEESMNATTDSDCLRARAIDALAEIVRNSEKHFLKYANETTTQCINWINKTKDIDERKSLLNLFGALTTIVGEDLSGTLPLLIQNIEICALDTSHEAKNDGNTEVTRLFETGLNEAENFDGACPCSKAKEQAIRTIDELTENCPVAITQYSEGLYAVLCKCMENACLEIAKCSFSAVKNLVVNWVMQTKEIKAVNALQSLVQNFFYIIYNNKHKYIVGEALDSVCDIIVDMGNEMGTPELRSTCAQCILDGLNCNYHCQRLFSEYYIDYDEESKSDKAVVEGIACFLASFGRTYLTAEFVVLFEEAEPLIFEHFSYAKDEENYSLYGTLIGYLSECYASLGSEVKDYFLKHYDFMIRSIKFPNTKTQMNAIFGIGELVRFGGEISYSFFPDILKTLSQIASLSPKRIVTEKLTGALARLVLTNCALVPLEQVVPVLVKNLSLIQNEDELAIILQGFHLLFENYLEPMNCHIRAIVNVAITAVANEACKQALVDVVSKLLRKILEVRPTEFKEALMHPDLEELRILARERLAWVE